MNHLFSLCLLNIIGIVFCFPSGAPVSQCQEMLPSHGVEPIKTRSPFEIQVQKVSDKLYTVTLFSKTNKFKGFILEARADDKIIGTWSTSQANIKTINCSGAKNSAATHTWSDDEEHDSKSKFSKIELKWTVPENLNTKKVVFKATVVEEFKKIYVDIEKEIELVTGPLKKNINVNDLREIGYIDSDDSE